MLLCILFPLWSLGDGDDDGAAAGNGDVENDNGANQHCTAHHSKYTEPKSWLNPRGKDAVIISISRMRNNTLREII